MRWFAQSGLCRYQMRRRLDGKGKETCVFLIGVYDDVEGLVEIGEKVEQQVVFVVGEGRGFKLDVLKWHVEVVD